MIRKNSSNTYAYTIRVITLCTLLLVIITVSNCTEHTNNVPAQYIYLEPDYSVTNLVSERDTLMLPLNEDTYNEVKSFNLFVEDNTDYFSFFEKRSASINIYDLQRKSLIKRLQLQKMLPDKKFYKTSVFTKGFDSIFIINKTTLYLVDSTGHVKRSIDFLKSPRNAWAVFENEGPPIFKDNILYIGVRPYVSETSFKELKKWKIFYGFDLINNKARLYYNLPDIYKENLYGYHFLGHSYCVNNQGHLVISFPADTAIYETDLAFYHRAYFAKSHYQNGEIEPLTKSELDAGFKNYLLRDSYGPIYFDAYARRYLRVAKSKTSQSDYDAKRRSKKQRIIILDESFKIIGESNIDSSIALNSIFFTSDGRAYGRTNVNNEFGLYFVRLAYQGKPYDQKELTKK